MDDEHVLAFVEAVNRTDFDAIHNLATNAVVVDDIGQLASLRHIALWNAFANYFAWPIPGIPAVRLSGPRSFFPDPGSAQVVRLAQAQPD
jgi:hypothetical protein